MKALSNHPAGLAGLDKTTLRDQALTALREAITTGRMPPGTRLVEAELCETLNISRGTLREALRQLQQQGLVVAGPGGRLHTRVLSVGEIADIFAVRAALESLAAEILCALPDRSAIAGELEKRLEAIRDAEGDLPVQAEADLLLHLRMCELTGNQTLVASWHFLSGQIRATILNTGSEVLHNMSWKRHEPIVRAIQDGDRNAARDIIRAHMDEAATRVTRVVESRADAQDTAPGS